MAALTACGGETVEAGQPKTEYRDYCEKTLAIESYPEPDIDFESMSPDQGTEQTKMFAGELVPLAEQVRAVAPAEIRNDINVLADAVAQVRQNPHDSEFLNRA